MKTSTQLSFDFEAPSPLQLRTPTELFLSADEELLRKLHEDRRFEAKACNFAPRPIGEYLCMWANTAEGGLLAIGVQNDGSLEGCSTLSHQQLNEMEKAGHTFCPDVALTSKRIEIHRDRDNALDFVVLFLVEYNRTRVVRTTGGKVFVRVGDSIKELRQPDEIRRLQAEKGEISFEADPVSLTYPRDFDLQAIKAFVSSVAERRNWDDQHAPEEILELLHLGTMVDGDFKPNVACALLFAFDPRTVCPGCRIRFLRFEGEREGTGEHWNAVKDEYIEGTVPMQIQRAEQLLSSQLRTFSRLGPGGRFITSPEYPQQAWYEAVVNACVHRSYGNGLSNMNIFVKMFDDRLEIESPGAFPPFVTPQNIYDMHSPRNPYLMEAMYYLKYVKCAHEGTRRIRDTLRRMNLPEPEFRQHEVAGAIVRVTLRNDIKQRKVWVDADVAELLGAQLAQQLTEDQKRCLNSVAEHGYINVSDAQRLTGKTWETAKKTLMSLVDKNILEHTHRDDLERDPKARFTLKYAAQPESDGT